MYIIKYKPHKKWKVALSGIKNGLVRTKKQAEFLAENIAKVKEGYETKVKKA